VDFAGSGDGAAEEFDVHLLLGQMNTFDFDFR
jgi:hypothetical protein